MHHPYEHGKDIIALNSDGDLCVYQLKGGQGKLGIPAIGQVEGQLFTAATAAVTHPSLSEPRPPDRVILVTNQIATSAAQDRIRVLSEGYRNRGLGSLQLIERAELGSRFVAVEGRFFPSSPKALNTFLSLFLADGQGELPRHDFLRLLEEILPVCGKRPKAAEAGRAISAAALTTAFALRRWVEQDNHAEIAMGWICYASQVLRLAERIRLGRSRWDKSYRLALEEARRHARHLLDEATAAEDLVIPDFAEPIVYRARAVKVCGLVSAFTVSERIEFGAQHPHHGIAGQLVLRELDCLQILGEVQAPDYFLSVLAVSEAGEHEVAKSLLLSWVASVATVNRRESISPLPNPYHSVEDIMLDSLSPMRTELSDEDFSGSAYTVHIGVRWAARRVSLEILDATWASVSRIQHHNFKPGTPVDYLTPVSRCGEWNSWFYPTPTRWSDLLAEVERHDVSTLPTTLLRCPEFVPFYCLALPHRFNDRVSDLLDRLASDGTVS